MGPAALVLAAASLAGGILGGKRKHIDPEWLKQHFGPGAVSEEALNLFNNLINSPYGQKIMTNAAEQGQQFGRNVNQQAAESGLAGPEGTSGTGIFATSAAQGATDSLQRGVKGDFYQMVLPIAQQMVSERMQAYLNDQQQGGYQTGAAKTWQQIGQAAGTAGAMIPENTQQPQGTQSSVPFSGIPSTLKPPSPYPSFMQAGSAPMKTSMTPNVNPVLPTMQRQSRFDVFRNVQPASTR